MKTLSWLAALVLTNLVHASTGDPVMLDLLVDGVPVNCQSGSEVRIHGLTGNLVATCDDGTPVNCLVAPWDWVLEQQPLRLSAMCQTKSGSGFEIQVTPTTQNVAVGSSAQWQVRVKNLGPGPLSSVQITTTPATAGCNRTFSNINAGAQISYGCALYNVTGNTSVHFAGTAMRSGSPVNTAANATVTTDGGGPGPSGAFIQLSGCATLASSSPGLTAWDVSISNIGSQTLTNVTVTDTQASNCSRVVGTIASGATVTFQCSSTSPGPHTGELKVTGHHTAYMLMPPCTGCASPGAATLPLLTLSRSGGDVLFANGFQAN